MSKSPSLSQLLPVVIPSWYHTMPSLPIIRDVKWKSPWYIGFRMGMGKPAVFLKWVPQVQVQCWFLPHCNTPHTCAAVSQVCTVSYSGIVTRVFTWFLIIYFTILIITGSNIIKLDRGNNEGRENK